VAGIALDHVFRTTLGRPVPAAVFLSLNGLVLLTVERLRGRRNPAPPHPDPPRSAPPAHNPRASRAHDRLTQEDHVGVLRSWHERFGAEVRYLDAVALGLVVAKPPTERGEVARVAVEQSAYCDDLDQFIGEPHRVAQLQVPNTHRYFWWD
jgi:hypothetical protein